MRPPDNAGKPMADKGKISCRCVIPRLPCPPLPSPYTRLALHTINCISDSRSASRMELFEDRLKKRREGKRKKGHVAPRRPLFDRSRAVSQGFLYPWLISFDFSLAVA